MRIVLVVCFAFVVGFVFGKSAPDQAVAEEKKAGPGYMVVMGKNYETEDMMPYALSLPPVYAKYEGDYAAFTTNIENLEGEYPYKSIIIAKFPSVEHVQQFWNSPEYIESKKLREGVGEFNVIAIEGVPE